jgi:hypothetical protein
VLAVVTETLLSSVYKKCWLSLVFGNTISDHVTVRNTSRELPLTTSRMSKCYGRV